MFQGRLVTVAIATVFAVGCSPSSDKRAMSELFTSDAAPVAETTPEEAAAPAPLVEVNASAEKPGSDLLLANEGAESAQTAHRPIMLPKLNYETVTRTETFEIGNDVTTDETVASLASAAPVQPAAVSNVASFAQEFSTDPRFAPTYPDRPIPSPGMNQNEVLAAAGEPANRMTGIGSEVWDYGTYRVFFSQDEVAFTRVW